jgi:hypothetical protein
MQDLVSGANGMLGSSALQDNSWPYWWAVPRANSQYVQRVGSIPTPDPGVITEICKVQVPIGFVFVLRAIRQSFACPDGGASPWVEGSGDILWTVDVDNPVGSIALSGYGLPDMVNMADARGSLIAPWPVEGYTVFQPYQVIRYKVVTTAVIPVGVPNYVTCGLFGWFEKAL